MLRIAVTLLALFTLAASNAHAAPLTLAANTATSLGVEVVYGPCPTAEDADWSAGCTYPGSPVVYVDDPEDTLTLLHELGHQFSFLVLGSGGSSLPGPLRKFARLTRDGEARKYTDVQEQFADAYATCVLDQMPRMYEWGYIGDDFPTGHGYAPTPRIQRQVCGLIRRAEASWRARTQPPGPTASGSSPSQSQTSP